MNLTQQRDEGEHTLHGSNINANILCVCVCFQALFNVSERFSVGFVDWSSSSTHDAIHILNLRLMRMSEVTKRNRLSFRLKCGPFFTLSLSLTISVRFSCSILNCKRLKIGNIGSLVNSLFCNKKNQLREIKTEKRENDETKF